MYQFFSVSTTTIRNWGLQGLFLEPYKLSRAAKLGRAARWRKKEILALTSKKNKEQIGVN
ncbi:DNA-binding protein [Bartonella sp. DB5-6]|uniref:DNA-binding protein n=1 Tax=Bartonella sp. DB5-6 TaxID=1094755 RepID=UPI0009DAFE02|nr:DNA-binding protein [Bartonella sp. DB5-6]